MTLYLNKSSNKSNNWALKALCQKRATLLMPSYLRHYAQKIKIAILPNACYIVQNNVQKVFSYAANQSQRRRSASIRI